MDKKRMVANEQKAYLELHAVIAQMGFVRKVWSAASALLKV